MTPARVRSVSDQLRLSWTRKTLYHYSNHSLARYINRLSTEPDGFGIEFNNSYSGPILLSYQVLGLSQGETLASNFRDTQIGKNTVRELRRCDERVHMFQCLVICISRDRIYYVHARGGVQPLLLCATSNCMFPEATEPSGINPFT